MRVHRSATIAIALVLLGAVNAAQPGTAAVDEGRQASSEVRITEFPLPDGSQPGGIVSGPDGALWFYETGTNQIGRITTDGQITEYPIPTADASEQYQGFLGVGPDGAIWFTENRTIGLGRISTDGQVTNADRPDRAQPRTEYVGMRCSAWPRARTAPSGLPAP